MQQRVRIANPFQTKIAVFCDCCLDQFVKRIFFYKPSYHFLRSEKQICAIHRMIHGSRLKTVESPDLLKPSDIVQQPDDLRQLNIFLSQIHPGCDLFRTFYHTVGMYDFQMNLVICPVILIQIRFKSRLCRFKINMQFLFLHRFFLLFQ